MRWGDQVDAVHREADGAEHPLGDRVAQKARVGADHGVAEAAAAVRLLLPEGQLRVEQRNQLVADGDQQHGQVFPQVAVRALPQEGVEDIAGQHHVEHEVGEDAFAFLADHLQLPDEEAHRHHHKDIAFQ